MRVKSALGAVALLLLPTHLPRPLSPALDRQAAAAPRPLSPAPLRVLEGTIGARSTVGSVLARVLAPGTVHALVEAARPAYDLARVSAGRPYSVVLRPDGLLAAFSYGIDELRTLRVVRRGEALEARVVTRDVEVRVERVEGVIRSSLFAAVHAAGEQDQLALDLADVFAWDVDFNTELQAGDSFAVLVEKRSVEGRPLGYGALLAAELLRGERTLRAVRFEEAGVAGYYSPDGLPLRKAFLRSPLRFTRISSRFSHSRLHPVLNVRRPHLGVDFAAPAGTPVRASGDGVVTAAGWMGGFGNTVELRHPNGYETLYGHLSRIAVRRGQRLAQGQVLGTVGSTGLATGPHLDYRVRRNGAYVNPLRMQSPPAEPIPAAARPAFERLRDERLALLAWPSSPRLALGGPGLASPPPGR